MIRTLLALAALLAHPAAAPSTAVAQDSAREWSLVIHGGAGTIRRESMTPEMDAEIRAKLAEALAAGSAVLEAGGESIDAVQAAIMVLEDDANFNAGKGAVFTWEGTNSLDASIMRGDTLAAGAVAGVSTTKNPILAARAVMEDSPHVLLSGEGADRFATERGIEQVDPAYFATPERRNALERFKAATMEREKVSQLEIDHKFGTVGAVAMDKNGVIAAGTSTGGMTGKRWGRIGDAPIIGAGTYATDRCGVSATGTGEYFIRLAVAHMICSEMQATRRIMSVEAGNATGPCPADAVCKTEDARLALETVQAIADSAITQVRDLGGSGGVIYLGTDGTPGWSFDTPGMYRGSATSEGQRRVAIYGDED
ncbi:isoaspartyl peptidase/L-asparaginase [Sphingomicrobium sp. XHP0235]|uniref:isoaspartyl peptidase/L-asparaginase family protein n=1 Tax=Sphingomicrobium aquimarinum TaxID=3133971 RepID=UPI0031FE72EF